jgi:hypothetical protein
MEWKLCETLYPSPEEIVGALQDVGKSETVKRKGREITRQKYPLILKLARKIYTNIQKELNPEGLTKNISRGAQALYKEIVLVRRHVDISETDVFFHSYGIDGQVFLITNEPKRCGIDVAIGNFQSSIEAFIKQKNSARTCNDGLRLASILLDSKHRESVSGIMSKKKNRAKSDIAGDHVTNFYEVARDEFMCQEYIATNPDDRYYNEFPEEERGSWDPNSYTIFEEERSTEWVRDTWESYVRPKYKKALDKWNKETGGGDGSPSSFIDYCAGDRWLVWIFCKDIDANFLLAGNAAGRMPNHLQFEAGFTIDDSSSSLTASDFNGSAKKRVLESEIESAKKQKQELKETMDSVRSYLQNKYQAVGTTKGQNLRQIAEYSRMMIDSDVLDTMSPDSKAVYLESLKEEWKNVMNQLKE